MRYFKSFSTVEIVLILLVIIIVIMTVFSSGVKAKINPNMNDFFYAIGEVESNNNDNCIADGGHAVGRYCIHYNYWLDSKIGYGSYQDCKKKEYAEKVMTKYWERYCPVALRDCDFETLAKVHNAGPNGNRIKAAEKYWQKVKNVMDNEN